MCYNSLLKSLSYQTRESIPILQTNYLSLQFHSLHHFSAIPFSVPNAPLLSYQPILEEIDRLLYRSIKKKTVDLLHQFFPKSLFLSSCFFGGYVIKIHRILVWWRHYRMCQIKNVCSLDLLRCCLYQHLEKSTRVQNGGVKELLVCTMTDLKINPLMTNVPCIFNAHMSINRWRSFHARTCFQKDFLGATLKTVENFASLEVHQLFLSAFRNVLFIILFVFKSC